MNRADLLIRRGTYDARGSGLPIGGLDCAGEILEVGEGVTGLAVGDRVMSMAGGAYAERVAVDARRPVPLPAGWSFAEGAASITGLLTEHDALTTGGGLRPGDAVVIHGAASGVGQQGVALAARLGARTVVAVVRRHRPDARALLEGLGASLVVAAGEEGTVRRRGAGGDRGGARPRRRPRRRPVARRDRPLPRAVRAGREHRAPRGHDRRPRSRRARAKRARIIGSTFRIRGEDEIAAVVAALRAAVGDALAAGELRARVDRTFPLADAEAAQEHMAADGHLGKIVLEVGP